MGESYIKVDSMFLEYFNHILDVALDKKEGTIGEKRLADKLRQVARHTLSKELFSEENLGNIAMQNIEEQKSARASMRK